MERMGYRMGMGSRMTQRGLLWIGLLLVGAALAAGCTPGGGGADLRQYFPGKPGDFWHYAGEGNEFAGRQNQLQHRQGELLQIASDTGGTTLALIYKATKTELLLLHQQEEWYDNSSLLGGSFPGTPEVILKAPLLVGQTWSSTTLHGETATYEIIAVGATLTLPVGPVSDVVQVKRTIAGVPEPTYFAYAKGIGLVEIRFDLGGGQEITTRLQSYQVTP